AGDVAGGCRGGAGGIGVAGGQRGRSGAAGGDVGSARSAGGAGAIKSKLATLQVEGGAAALTFDRPEARNALAVQMLAEALARIGELEQMGDSAPTVLTITGAGKAFCAGMDLKEIVGEQAPSLQLLSSLAELCQRIRALPMVTVAKVNGAAIGGG